MAPMIAAPILIMRLRMNPKKTPTMTENTKDANVLKNVSSSPFYVKEPSILSIKKSSMVIPNPAMPPVVKMVTSKNLRPKKATTKPNIIARMPNICGRLTKNEANLVTEKTGQALE